MIDTSSLSSNLGKECQSIQRAIGEKLGTLVVALSMAMSGIIFSMLKGWYYCLLLLLYFPIIFLMGFLIIFAVSRGFSDNMKAYA